MIGGLALNAYGYARATLDFDVAAEERVRRALTDLLRAGGFEVLNDVEGFTNLLHPDVQLGRLDVMWLDGETAERVFGRVRRLERPGGPDVPVPSPEHLVAMKVGPSGTVPLDEWACRCLAEAMTLYPTNVRWSADLLIAKLDGRGGRWIVQRRIDASSAVGDSIFVG